jgi:hypothetical protein
MTERYSSQRKGCHKDFAVWTQQKKDTLIRLWCFELLPASYIGQKLRMPTKYVMAMVKRLKRDGAIPIVDEPRRKSKAANKPMHDGNSGHFRLIATMECEPRIVKRKGMDVKQYPPGYAYGAEPQRNVGFKAGGAE